MSYRRIKSVCLVYGSSLETAISYGSNDIHMGLEDFKSIYNFEVIGNVLKDDPNKCGSNELYKTKGLLQVGEYTSLSALYNAIKSRYINRANKRWCK